jgi:hypothetical protein
MDVKIHVRGLAQQHVIQLAEGNAFMDVKVLVMDFVIENVLVIVLVHVLMGVVMLVVQIV